MICGLILLIAAAFLLFRGLTLWGAIAGGVGILVILAACLMKKLRFQKQRRVADQTPRKYWPVFLRDEAQMIKYLEGEPEERLTRYGLVAKRKQEQTPARKRVIHPALQAEAQQVREALAACETAAEMLAAAERPPLAGLCVIPRVRSVLEETVKMEQLYGGQGTASLKKVDRLLDELIYETPETLSE